MLACSLNTYGQWYKKPLHQELTALGTDNMKTQLINAIQNLEQVITEAGHSPQNIVRLNVYTTSTAELFTCFDIFQDWIAKHGIQQASTLLEVKSLFETLKLELEAPVVK